MVGYNEGRMLGNKNDLTSMLAQVCWNIAPATVPAHYVLWRTQIS